MKLLHGILVVCLALFVSGDNQFRPDYEHYTLAKGWLKFHKVPARWEDARMLCDFEGAVLASPLDEDMSNIMYSIINKTASAYFGVYTGVHNTISPAMYQSIEGVLLMPIGNNEMFSEEYISAPSCMRLLPQAGLVAGSCNDSLPFMCYKKKTAELEINECGTVDKGYQLDVRTGHCYKFHKDALVWRLAFLTCAAEGGHLAIINSAVEAQVFKELFAKHSASIKGGLKDVVHLGFYDWNKNGIWRTIHGQQLEEAGYHRWDIGQPNDGHSVDSKDNKQGQHCGCIYQSGLLNDLECDIRRAFICERDPKSVLMPINA